MLESKGFVENEFIKNEEIYKVIEHKGYELQRKHPGWNEAEGKIKALRDVLLLQLRNSDLKENILNMYDDVWNEQMTVASEIWYREGRIDEHLKKKSSVKVSGEEIFNKDDEKLCCKSI